MMKWWKEYKSEKYKNYERDYKQLPRKYHSFKWVDHPLYNTWHQMKARCYDETNIGYENYGGRGIRVSKKWMFNFERFVSDMGERPDGFSIDRIDNNKNYKKSNCKWSNRTDQNQNKRVYITNNTGYSGIVKISDTRYTVRSKNTRERIGSFKTLDEAITAQKEGLKFRRARSDSSTRIRGVSPISSGKYKVRVTFKDGVRRVCGYVDTIEEGLELREFVESECGIIR